LEEEWAAWNRDPLDNANTIVESTGCSWRTITSQRRLFTGMLRKIIPLPLPGG
jgi:hypothetical protein